MEYRYANGITGANDASPLRGGGDLSLGGCASNQAREAGICTRSAELLKHLSELADAQAELRARLLGAVPSPQDLKGGSTCLQEALEMACHMAATLAMEARNILNRIS